VNTLKLTYTPETERFILEVSGFISRFPFVVGSIRYAMLAADFTRLGAKFDLFEGGHDLLFTKSRFLHRALPSLGKTLLQIGRVCEMNTFNSTHIQRRPIRPRKPCQIPLRAI